MKKLVLPFIFLFVQLQQVVNAVESPQVAVSIKPIHSLVSAVMEGVGTPELIVQSGSPHGYTLRPSEAKALSNADLVIWVGHELEGFLDKPLKTLAKDAKKLELADVLVSSLLAKRTTEQWETHDHSSHEAHDGDEKHEEHAAHDDHEKHEEHAAHDDHEKHEEHAAHDDHEKHEEHVAHDDHEGSSDLHIWLSPKVAQKIVNETTKALIEIDPANAELYKMNETKVIAKLTELDAQLVAKLAPVQKTPYLVFHAAYQYFETSYKLNAVGSVTIDPDRKPGAKRITEIRKKVHDLNARAVFSEPQFESKLVATIIEGTAAKTAVLDPLGSSIPAGTEAYFQLMNNLADDLINGLK